MGVNALRSPQLRWGTALALAAVLLPGCDRSSDVGARDTSTDDVNAGTTGAGSSASPTAQSPDSPAQTTTAPQTAAAGTVVGPGEEWVVYQALFDEAVDLGLVRPDGTGAHRLASGPGNRWHPDWSPDGRWLAYDHNLPRGVAEIWLAAPDGSEDRPLTSCEDPCLGQGGPSWSLDGQWVAFDGAEDSSDEYPDGLCYTGRVNVESGEIDRMLEFPGCAGGGVDGQLSAVIYPTFSPDGSSVVGQGLDGAGRSAIFTATVDGENLTRLTDWGVGARPHWSPDGQWIVFMEKDADANTQGAIGIYRVQPGGAGLEQLTKPEGTRLDLYPRYLPDGSAIIYSRCPEPEAAQCEARLLAVDAASDDALLTAPGFNPVHFVWRPGD